MGRWSSENYRLIKVPFEKVGIHSLHEFRHPRVELLPRISLSALSLRQTLLMRCTGEHLTAHKDGGAASTDNILAACFFCNSRRHKRKKDLTPEKYKTFVLKHVEKMGWHNLSIMQSGKAGEVKNLLIGVVIITNALFECLVFFSVNTPQRVDGGIDQQ